MLSRAVVPSSTRSTSQKQEQDLYLQSFPAESQSSHRPISPAGIAREKATEVALLAFSPEQNDSPRHLPEPPEDPAPPVQLPGAPISVACDGSDSGFALPLRRWALAVGVCGAAVAAIVTFVPARVPAKSLPPAIAPAAVEAEAAISAPTEPTGTCRRSQPYRRRRPPLQRRGRHRSRPRRSPHLRLERSTPPLVGRSNAAGWLRTCRSRSRQQRRRRRRRWQPTVGRLPSVLRPKGRRCSSTECRPGQLHS